MTVLFSYTALCPDLEPVTNGDVSYLVDVTGPFRDVGTMAMYSCVEGFGLIGSESRECLEGGAWSGDTPTCEGTVFSRLNARL